MKKRSFKEYVPPDYGSDYIEKTSDDKYSVFVYNIREWRMLCYAGLFAIVNEKVNQIIVLNSAKTWIWFDEANTFDYAPLSDCLIFRKPAYNPDSRKPDFPFILIKPGAKVFSFLEWDGTSIYYGFNEIEADILQVREVHPKDLDALQHPRKTNAIIRLEELPWHNFVHFDNALEMYFAI